MRVSKTFRWQPLARRLTDNEVGRRIHERFPQFRFNVESNEDSVTVTFLHPLTEIDLNALAGLLDEFNSDKMRECDEVYDSLPEKLRSLTVEQIHNHFQDRRATIQNSNLTAAQKALLVSMCDDDERLTRVLLCLLKHQGF